MDITKFRFYVGTVRGALLYTGDKPNDLNVSKNEENCEVTAISEGRNPEEIVIGYENGNASIYNTEKNVYFRKISELEGDENVTGVGCLKKSIILAKRNGIINIWTAKKNDYFSTNLDEKSSLDAMVCNQNRKNIIGTGGECNDFKLWDVETKQCVFKAKSLGHDELQLPIPTSVRGIAFFSADPNLSSCCTKEGHVLLYDDRAQRRPIIKFLEPKASYSTIATAYRDRQVFVGTTKGYMQWLDLKTVKCLKTYKTFTGGVTSIVCDAVEPLVASTCLDRYMRVHNIETKELLYKCYMKQSLTKLLMKPIVKEEATNPENESDKNIDKEYEELFESMETVVSDEKQKRKFLVLTDKEIKKVKKKKVKEV